MTASEGHDRKCLVETDLDSFAHYVPDKSGQVWFCCGDWVVLGQCVGLYHYMKKDVVVVDLVSCHPKLWLVET